MRVVVDHDYVDLQYDCKYAWGKNFQAARG